MQKVIHFQLVLPANITSEFIYFEKNKSEKRSSFTCSLVIFTQNIAEISRRIQHLT